MQQQAKQDLMEWNQTQLLLLFISYVSFNPLP